MQVTETRVDGLKREYQVVLPAAELDKRASERLSTIKGQVKLAGFRPGKVPLPHLKRLYGKSVMGEVIEQAISEANNQIVSERGLRLALQPRITLANEEEGAVKEVIEGRADLAFTVAIEVLPKVELTDFKSISLVRPVHEVTDAEIDEMVGNIAEFEPAVHDQDRQCQGGEGRPRGGLLRRHDRRKAVRGRLGRGRAGGDRAGRVPARLRRSAHRHRGRRHAHHQDHVPEELPRRCPRWPGCDLRGHGQERGSADRGHDRRCIRQDARARIARQAQGSGARSHRARPRGSLAREAEADTA